MTTQIIIGAGEVGQALHEVLPDAYLRDISDTDNDCPERADVLHIAFPYDALVFTAQVNRYQGMYGADLVIVHSTVPVGTCDPFEWVHSPVRGRHPDLAESLRTFIKHFGGKRATEASDLWVDSGVSIGWSTDLAATTEAGKLWEMVQFGIQIAVEKEIYAWCEEKGLGQDEVYTYFAATYNVGYQDLGHHHFTRPVLDHVPGPIGGHCVLRACELLGHPLGDFVRGASEAAAWADDQGAANKAAAQILAARPKE